MDTIDDLDSRVRRLYADYRTARLNQKYYGAKLARARWWCRAIDFFLAGVAPGSGIAAGWAIWSVGSGKALWTILASLAALVALAKPLIDLPGVIERCGKLFVGHGDIYYDLGAIVREVESSHTISEALLRRHQDAYERFRKLAVDDDPVPNKELQTECYWEVCREIPHTSLWYP